MGRQAKGLGGLSANATPGNKWADGRESVAVGPFNFSATHGAADRQPESEKSGQNGCRENERIQSPGEKATPAQKAGEKLN